MAGALTAAALRAYGWLEALTGIGGGIISGIGMSAGSPGTLGLPLSLVFLLPALVSRGQEVGLFNMGKRKDTETQPWRGLAKWAPVGCGCIAVIPLWTYFAINYIQFQRGPRAGPIGKVLDPWSLGFAMSFTFAFFGLGYVIGGELSKRRP